MICIDCDPETQRLMHERGRCKFPDTVFIDVLDDEGDEIVVGVAP